MFIRNRTLALRRFYSSPKYVLPDLPYDYNALEPVISAEIMQIHHQKHHQAYITNLNTALNKFNDAESAGNLSEQVSLQSAIKFNAGGHINHSIFWENLTPKNKYEEPKGQLAEMIARDFGSLKSLQNELSAKSAAVQGSGWGWLAFNKDLKRLVVMTCPNQDPVVSVNAACVPLLGIDVWEHAYYLQYKNVRPDYLKAIWEIVNWQDVAKRLAKAA